MGTGLIYAAIVAAWAAYLVPGWLRRHEEVVEAPAVDRPPPPARVLERRPSGRNVSAATAHDPATVHDPATEADDGMRQPTRRGATRPSPVVRRRRILVGLIGLTTVVAVLGAFQLAPWWALAVPVGVVASYLLVCAIAAREHRTHGTRGAAPIVPAARAPGSERTAAAAGRGARTTAARLAETADCPVHSPLIASASADESADDHAPSGEGAVRGVPAARVPVVRESADPGLWDPVQVPLPTYVTKAKATRTVRTVELGEPNTWTAGRLPEAELLTRSDESTTMLLDETEHPGSASDEPPSDAGESEHRRAVGD